MPYNGSRQGYVWHSGHPLGHPLVFLGYELVKHGNWGPRFLRDEGKKYPPELKGNLKE